MISYMVHRIIHGIYLTVHFTLGYGTIGDNIIQHRVIGGKD
jgi:hypothetical protein